MKFRLLGALCCVTQIAFTSACAKPAVTAPSGVDAKICRPTFSASDSRYVAGTAFLLRVGIPPQNLLVTAHHLFGPAGGLAAQISSADLPTKVRMEACAAYREEDNWHAAAPIEIAGAHAGYDEAAMLDIAAFPLAGRLPVAPLRLALHAPKKGDPVWLVAEVVGAPAKSLLHSGTVLNITEHLLIVVYDAPFEITGTSGAPIVDENGDVVGVNAAGGYDESTRKMLSAGTGWNAIQRALNPPN